MFFISFILILFLVPLIALLWLWPRYDYLPGEPLPFRAERVLDHPIIHAGLSPRLSDVAGQEGYVNINGPSLIRVPDWLSNTLGK